MSTTGPTGSAAPAAPAHSPGTSGRMRRFAALVLKESTQVVRDPSSILIALVLPMILLFLFGYGVSLDATRTRIGVVRVAGVAECDPERGVDEDHR